MNGRGRWLFVIAGTVALAVLLLGALLGGAPAPTPTLAPATATPTSAAATSVPQTAVPQEAAGVPTRVWFARDQLPPLAAEVLGSDPSTSPGGGNAVIRIGNRLSALWGARPPREPAGIVNEFARVGRQGSGGMLSTSVVVNGDLATVEFDLGGRGWGVSATAETSAMIQQLVYTITEEPGIRRALIKEKGKTTLEIGNAILDKPLTREDVFGYSFKGTETATIVGDGEQRPTTIASMKVTNEEVPGLGRFSVELAGGPGRFVPRFTARLQDSQGGNTRFVLRLDLPDTEAPNPKIPFERFVSGPINAIDSPHTRGPADVGAIFVLELDDARPWRVTVEPTAAGTTRINVDVGGRPEWVNKNIAVYSLRPGPGGRGITVRGAARVFEASVSWRMRDASGRVIARGSTTATLGTSPVWGTFELTNEIPGSQGSALPGAHLDIYWVSPRDGAEGDVITIPLGVRGPP